MYLHELIEEEEEEEAEKFNKTNLFCPSICPFASHRPTE